MEVYVDVNFVRLHLDSIKITDNMPTVITQSSVVFLVRIYSLYYLVVNVIILLHTSKWLRSCNMVDKIHVIVEKKNIVKAIL